MRVRVALATLLVLMLATAYVVTSTTEAEGRGPGSLQSGQSLADPPSPHRLMAAPLDTAVLDVAPPAVIRAKHKAHPVGTRNHPRPVRVARQPVSKSLAAIRRCIIQRESNGSYTARNKHSTASGAYQFIDGTWNHYGGYARAYLAPPAVQDAKFLLVWNNGKGRHNWYLAGHTQCW